MPTLRDALPGVVQDALRTTLDVAAPTRRRHARAQRQRRPDPLTRKVSPSGLVLGGPFAGMTLDLHTAWGGLAARMAGTYECELTSHLERFIASRPVQVVDIGAAEGYYAVGLARALPDRPIVCFELERAGRVACRRNVALNQVENVRVRGRATPGNLKRTLRPGALVICDCEGYEQVLIDPTRVPMLSTCSLLVELHEWIVPGITATITSRFSASHDITLVDQEARDLDPPQLSHLSPQDAAQAMEEGRSIVLPDGGISAPQQWAVMHPLAG